MAQQQKVDGIATSDSQHCALCTSTGPIHTLMMPSRDVICTHPNSCQLNTLTLLTAGTCSLCFPDCMHQNLRLCLTSSKTQGSRNKS
jgi:hypothetical protein